MGDGDNLPLICCGDLGPNKGLPTGETGQDKFHAQISLQIVQTNSENILSHCFLSKFSILNKHKHLELNVKKEMSSVPEEREERHPFKK